MVLWLFLLLKVILFVENLLSERKKDLVEKVFTFFLQIPSFERVQFNVGEKNQFTFSEAKKGHVLKFFLETCWWLIKICFKIKEYRKTFYVHPVFLFFHGNYWPHPCSGNGSIIYHYLTKFNVNNLVQLDT